MWLELVRSRSYYVNKGLNKREIDCYYSTGRMHSVGLRLALLQTARCLSFNEPLDSRFFLDDARSLTLYSLEADDRYTRKSQLSISQKSS